MIGGHYIFGYRRLSELSVEIKVYSSNEKQRLQRCNPYRRFTSLQHIQRYHLPFPPTHSYRSICTFPIDCLLEIKIRCFYQHMVLLLPRLLVSLWSPCLGYRSRLTRAWHLITDCSKLTCTDLVSARKT
jgi:hypothetical protein